MLERFRQELKRGHGARALIYSLQESKTGFTGTTASGAKHSVAGSPMLLVREVGRRALGCAGKIGLVDPFKRPDIPRWQASALSTRQ
jgi:hypothetical protein